MDLTGNSRDLAIEQHEVLRAFLHGTSEAFFCKDLQGRYLLVNPVFSQIFGRPESEIIGKDDFELMSEPIARVLVARDQEVLATGKTSTYDLIPGSLIAPGDTRQWITTKGVLRAPDGAVIGLFGITREVTEQRRVAYELRNNEERLRLNEERLRLSIEVAQLASWEWNIIGNAVSWSDNLSRVVGVPVEEFTRTYGAFLSLIDPQFRDTVVRALSETMSWGEDREVEFRVMPANAAPRWLRAKGRAMREGERAVRVIGVVRDVTSEKQAEEEAKRVSQFQDQLMAIVGHDIRSPVSAILAWAEVLKEGIPSDGLPATVDRIATSAGRIQRLSHLLMDFAHARLGRGIPVDFVPIDINQLCQDLVTEARVTYPDRQVVLEAAGNGEASGDPDRLSQALSNLIDNALKYSPPELPLEVTTRGVARWVVIEVKNGGPPIPSDLLPYVFDPFRRGAQVDAVKRPGLGLGLWIVREIIESHGGTIEVSSSEREGTVFTLVLPRLSAHELP